MRRFITFAVVFSLVIAAWASGSVSYGQRQRLGHSRAESNVRLISDSRHTYSDVQMPSCVRKANDKLSDLPLVTEVPGADIRSYSRDAFFFALDYNGQLVRSADYGLVSEVAFGEDGKVYFKNPYTGKDTGSYLVGELSGDEITVSLPQRIFREEYPDFDDPEGVRTIVENSYAFKLIYTEGELKSGFKVDNENQTVRFKVTENGIEMLGDAYIGLLLESVDVYESGQEVSKLNWTGFADTALKYTEMKDEPVVVPDGLVTESWVMSYGGVQRLVRCGFSGEDLYLFGVLDGQPDMVVKGRLVADKVIFDGSQYMGTVYDHYAYFIPASYSRVSDVEEEYSLYKPLASLEFGYDSEAGTLRCPVGHAMAVSTMPDAIFCIEAYEEPVFNWQDSSSPMTPSAPEVSDYVFYDEGGYGALFYCIPELSDDGRLLDLSRYYYNFIINGEPMVLYPDEYMSLEEEMTDIPYAYEDFDIYFWGDSHEAIIYAQGFKNIGIRTMYVNADGTKTYSPIVYANTSGISEISTDKGSPAKTEWFDIYGRGIANPQSGVYIRRLTFDDGTVRVDKIAK